MDKDRRFLPGTKSERHLLKYRSTECLNCYHPLDRSDQYCPNCSQLNSTKKLTFNDFFNEFFAGIFAYDSRFYRTLRVLLFKPGKISKDYIEGKRVRYANPYRFYLSASIIFFLIWSFTHDYETTGVDDPKVLTMNSPEADSVLVAATAANPELAQILPKLDTLKFEQKHIPESKIDSMSFFEGVNKQWELFSDFYEEKKIVNPEIALDSLDYDKTRFNLWLYKKTVDAEQFDTNSGLFWSYFYSKLPFIIFFYLPVFALFIWLLYARRPFTYMEHLIFTFHNQTTWFVLFGLAINLDLLFDTDFLTVIATFVFAFYLYKAFRTFYGQNRAKTILKFLIINFIFFTLAMFAAAFSLLASFAIY